MLSFIKRIARELAGPLMLLLLVIGMLHRALFSGGSVLVSLQQADLHYEYIPWRLFSIGEFKKGHFPLWNPHVFCGQPFFAEMQSALCYPVNWIYILLSPANAINIEATINIYLAALLSYLWARQRKLSRPAAMLGGAVFVFSGPYFLHLMAGHLTPLATMAMAPLIFLAVDRLLAGKTKSSFVIGAFAVCLQILSGHPQYVYYTAIGAGIYFLLFWISWPAGRWTPPSDPDGSKVTAGVEHPPKSHHLLQLIVFIGIYVFGALFSAVQLWPGYKAAQLSVRAGGTPYSFASTFSMPPINLLTLLVPYPLGDFVHVPYVGDGYIWELSLYVGITALLLAIVALVRTTAARRTRLIAALGLITVLCLGAHTVIYPWLYHYFPGFGDFRGTCKFNFLIALLLAMLAGEGWDSIRVCGRPAWAIVIAVVLAACFFTLAGLFANGIALYGHVADFSNSFVARQWMIGAIVVLAAGILIYLIRYSPKWTYVLLVLAVAEIFVAAADTNSVSSPHARYPVQWIGAVSRATAHDQRVLHLQSVEYGNLGMDIGYNDIWGFDPGVSKRYAQLLTFSQGIDPASAGMYLDFVRISPIFRLLRCRYVLQPKTEKPVQGISDPLGHLQLVGSYLRLNNSKAILKQLTNRNFHYRKSVVLETDPSIAPTPLGATGHVRLVHQDINDLEIQADLPAPAILLITDAFAPGWTVRPIELNPDQLHYQVLQADYVLRAIPLAAGHHHFVLEYKPRSVLIGIFVSLVSLICFIILLWLWSGKSRFHRATKTPNGGGSVSSCSS